MPEHGSPEGSISREDIAELALLFDRFEYALDPLATEAKEAQSQFEDRVLVLFREKVEPNYASIDLPLFRSKVKTICRVFLRKNLP
jgi:hypothetical protein